MDRPLPSTATMFRRAAMRACPHCGSSKSFIKHWLGRSPRCRTCGIQWHREHGFELGPIAVNVVFTFFSMSVIMIVAFVTTGPDYNVPALMALVIGAAILLPLVFYPFTYTLWLAFDLATHQPTERELADAAAAVASGAVTTVTR
jgi:uncharacterized protein (DUF983 family)